MINCNKGCYEVGHILFGGEYEDRDEAEEKANDILHTYDAYESIWALDYGHMNYALAAYCVDVGHIECLKKLHSNVDLQWHSDLADCVIEKDNLECLKFVVEVMKGVNIESNDKALGNNCRDYVKGLDSKSLDSRWYIYDKLWTVRVPT